MVQAEDRLPARFGIEPKDSDRLMKGDAAANASGCQKFLENLINEFIRAVAAVMVCGGNGSLPPEAVATSACRSKASRNWLRG